MSGKLLTEQHLEFLRLKGGCKGWSESTHVKIPHCWKSHVVAQLLEGGAAVYNFRSHQRISQRAVQTSLEKQLVPFSMGGGGGGPYQYI